MKANLGVSPIIASIEIVDERVLLNRGYFHARLTLTNGAFLEIAESFQLQRDRVATLDNRYQWMDASKQILKKRWDSVKHFPDLPSFPIMFTSAQSPMSHLDNPEILSSS